jgi:hypothetical protein
MTLDSPLAHGLFFYYYFLFPFLYLIKTKGKRIIEEEIITMSDKAVKPKKRKDDKDERESRQTIIGSTGLS